MLLIGYGNPGRGDDGLGSEFAERMAVENIAGLTCMSDYQLSAEHALAVADAACVIFADAMTGGAEPFTFAAVRPSEAASLASHDLAPATLLALARALYGKTPRAFILGIAGSDFGEVKEGLSAAAQANLEAALIHFKTFLREDSV